jgi:hypothetical protein
MPMGTAYAWGYAQSMPKDGHSTITLRMDRAEIDFTDPISDPGR